MKLAILLTALFPLSILAAGNPDLVEMKKKLLSPAGRAEVYSEYPDCEAKDKAVYEGFVNQELETIQAFSGLSEKYKGEGCEKSKGACYTEYKKNAQALLQKSKPSLSAHLFVLTSGTSVVMHTKSARVAGGMADAMASALVGLDLLDLQVFSAKGIKDFKPNLCLTEKQRSSALEKITGLLKRTVKSMDKYKAQLDKAGQERYSSLKKEAEKF